MAFSFFKKLCVTEAPTYQLPPGVRVYAIGDIHGQAQLLENALEAIAEDAKDFTGQRIIQVFLGDYIDRGMYSREVLDLLIQAPPVGHERICLLGNHETTLLKFLETPETIRKWSSFGGFTTLASYGIPIPRTLSGEDLTELHQTFAHALPASHQAFLESLQTHYCLGEYFFVHAGINPYLSLDEQSVDDLLWIRDDFLEFEKFHQKYIIHGHTPVETLDIRKNRANLDLSIATGEQLGCLKLEGNQRINFTILMHND
ncbi:MAG: metallophosphoesterase family protein [Rickettsiales bacterium]|nr:metallophosphoesterase family protein [Rickettsiales bacterium]